jgi:twitching motility protein PilU
MLGNFRVNLFRQRASISIVVRYILGNIPPLDSLSLPPVLVRPGDGKARV